MDCPHSGRNEVADKMIIVYAMQFAFLNPQGTMFCFITGDVDYAYLLAVLQQPQWKTIAISNRTMQSMLHGNCDMKMHWETDILQLRFTTQSPRLGFDTAIAATPAALVLETDRNNEEKGNSDEQVHNCRDILLMAPATPSFGPLTADEEREADVELLRTIMKTD